jgi:hypothetical protein
MVVNYQQMNTETLQELLRIAYNIRSAVTHEYHGACRHAAINTFIELKRKGFEPRIICGGLKGIAPPDWQHDTPPLKRRHYWAEVTIQNTRIIIEPNSSTKHDAGCIAVHETLPDSYITYPDSEQTGQALLDSRNTTLTNNR